MKLLENFKNRLGKLTAFGKIQFGILTAYEFGGTKEVEFGETKVHRFDFKCQLSIANFFCIMIFFCSLTGVPTSWARGAESQDPDFPSPISASRFRFGGCTPGSATLTGL